jgi:uncharacterized protein with PIN domain
MLSKTIQDGVIFIGECFNSLFTPGELRCPNCNGVLQEEIANEGEAYLRCSSKGKGCANPVKRFTSAREMYEWRDSTWEVIARICKQQA